MFITVLLVSAIWVGHACTWTNLLNDLYGRNISKKFLKPWRLFTGFIIVFGVPLLWWSVADELRAKNYTIGIWPTLVGGYFLGCGIIGIVAFPAVTVRRIFRRLPLSVIHLSTRTLDLWPELREKLIGNGKWRWVTRLPGNCVFRVDFTELTLAPRGLPQAWDGLTILLLSDLHFHGTPSREFFQRILDEIRQLPTPDIVAIAGDFVDTDTHHEWFAPLLGQFKWKEHGLAILGNHDLYHNPDRLRDELRKLGFQVLSNRSEELQIRGLPCTVVGHEGPWFRPEPKLDETPANQFRLCLSHTPDNFYWGQRHRVNLMLCGHVHGGQIRLPIIGSIFVPSIYSRRFDMGVFEENGTLMVVGRGLSGKEPLRFRCHPQVIRMTLKSSHPISSTP